MSLRPITPLPGRPTWWRGLLVLLLMIGLAMPTTSVLAATSTPSGFHQLAFFGKGGPGSAVYGANEPVVIIGGFEARRCLDGGTDDQSFPLIALSDVYVVPSGAGMTDGGKPHKVIAFGLLGLFEVIGATAPQGKLGPGTYDVYYDECQDGKYDAGIDAKWEEAFRVELPAVVPPSDPGLTELKRVAGLQEAATYPAVFVCEQKAKQAKREAARKNQGVSVSVSVSFSVGYPLLFPDFQRIDTCTMAKNMHGHFAAIAADPPDPDYRRTTTLPAVATALPEAAGTSEAAGQRLNSQLEALLHAVERYQGAQGRSDAYWAVHHLDEVERIGRAGARSAREYAQAGREELDAYVAAAPDLDDVLAAEAQTVQRWRRDGLTQEEQRVFLNAGFSPRDLAALPAALGGLPAGFGTLAEARDAAVAGERLLEDAARTMEALADRAQELSAVSRPSLGGHRQPPLADAGGPYVRTASEVVLDASGSSAGTPGGALRLDWDLDGDGSFDDASGSTVRRATQGLAASIGVRAVDARGLHAVDYAPVGGGPGLLTGVAPAGTDVQGAVGRAATFSATAAGGVEVTWLLDGQAVAAGPAFTFTPALSQAGVRTVTAEAVQGAIVATRSWQLDVPAPDADGDGYRANIDCDDARAGTSLDDCSVTYDSSIVAAGLGSVTGVSFDPSGRLFASNQDGSVFRLPLTPADGPVTRLGGAGLSLLGLTHIGERLFATAPRNDLLLELDPATGQRLRVVARLDQPNGLAYDPTTGDLVVGTTGGSPGVYRVADPLSDQASVRAVRTGAGIDGVAVGPDGTLYAAKYQFGIWALAGAAAAEPGLLLQDIPAPAADGIAVEVLGGRTVALWINGTSRNNGRIDRFDLTVTPPRQTRILEAGGYGDFVAVGPDGCMYATNPAHGNVRRVTNADGSCDLAPYGATSGVDLQPRAQRRAVGTQAELTVQLTPARATAVTLTVTGEHPQTVRARTGDDGRAVVRLAASRTGRDDVVATADDGDGSRSESAAVTWAAPANRPPALTAAEASTTSPASVLVPVEVHDPDGDTTRLRVLQGPSDGRAEVVGAAIRYTPAAGFAGRDRLVVVADDGQADSPPVEVAVVVRPADAPPTAGQVDRVVDAGSSTTVVLPGTDPEGPVTFSLPGEPEQRTRHGLVRLQGDRAVYVADAGYAGPDGFLYVVTDAGSQQRSGAVLFDVRAPSGGGGGGAPGPGAGPGAETTASPTPSASPSASATPAPTSTLTPSPAAPAVASPTASPTITVTAAPSAAPVDAASPSASTGSSVSPRPVPTQGTGGGLGLNEPVVGSVTGQFTPVTPARILDTRVQKDAVRAGQDRRLVVLGRGGVPARGVYAVVLNVTATLGSVGADVQVYPSGHRPDERTSNLNYTRGQTVPVQVQTGVGSDGSVALSVGAGSAHLVVDVFGWYADGSDTSRRGSGYVALPPSRVLDTRELRAPVVAGRDRQVRITGRAGVPADATAVMLNTTVLGTPANADLQVYPAGRRPAVRTSNLNVARGVTKANAVVAPVGEGGSIVLSASHNRMHVVLDVLGYYSPDSPGRFVPVVPRRLLDTRAQGGPVAAPADREVPVGRLADLPPGASAVMLGLTATGVTSPVDLQVFPTGVRPATRTSSLNLRPGQVVPNLVPATLGDGGSVSLSYARGSGHAVLDVLGYFTSPSAAQ